MTLVVDPFFVLQGDSLRATANDGPHLKLIPDGNVKGLTPSPQSEIDGFG